MILVTHAHAPRKIRVPLCVGEREVPVTLPPSPKRKKVMVIVATLNHPTAACPFCQEERCAEDVVRSVQGRRERGRGGVLFTVMVGREGEGVWVRLKFGGVEAWRSVSVCVDERG